MKATTLRRHLQDLKIAEQMVKNARENMKNIESIRNLKLHEDLANIEVALECVRKMLMTELYEAGLI